MGAIIEQEVQQLETPGVSSSLFPASSMSEHRKVSYFDRAPELVEELDERNRAGTGF
ncbi:MAG: hypothetical protein LCH36_03695 [Actinobacteria bacterium]|jgi:hypothetical protein|nr:hypothetical protein [Actinomycetota bacterium]